LLETNPDYLVREFAEDVKQRGWRGTPVLQAPDNAADMVESRFAFAVSNAEHFFFEFTAPFWCSF